MKRPKLPEDYRKLCPNYEVAPPSEETSSEDLSSVSKITIKEGKYAGVVFSFGRILLEQQQYEFFIHEWPEHIPVSEKPKFELTATSILTDIVFRYTEQQND